MGAEAVKKLLEQLDLVDVSNELREELDNETRRTSRPSRS